jgi:pimeloyl-ACP methyl ester carboxylesterase
LAVATVAMGLAVWAHYAFWSRRYRLPERADEVLFADTSDGWRLALAHRRPGRAAASPPVLLVHGIAANHQAFDFGLDRWSLASHLAAAGLECFSLDLRGHGASFRAGRARGRLRRGAPHGWSFDDYLRLDVPAALDAVAAVTGSRQVLWVGHSQGGLLGMAACEAYPDRIAGLVSLAAPVFFDVQDPLKLAARLGFLLTGQLNRFAARCLAPYAGYYHPPVSEVAINGRNVDPPVLRRVLVNVVENISAGVLRQFGGWITRDAFDALDGSLDYRAALGRCHQPALFVAADGDRIAPPSVVERTAAAWGGPADLLRIGLAGSACCDYGHSDLLFGRSAPEEVFPRIRDWLLTHGEGGLA